MTSFLISVKLTYTLKYPIGSSAIFLLYLKYFRFRKTMALLNTRNEIVCENEGKLRLKYSSGKVSAC